MKRIPTILAFVLFAVGGSLGLATPMGTAFTYQGRLLVGANPADGTYDLRFAIYDSLDGPGLIAGPLTNRAVAVSNGLFTVALDFGSAPFSGEDRWLEIAVHPSHLSMDFTTLTPRQLLTPAPQALYAPSAGTATNAGLLNGHADSAFAPATGSPAYVAKAGDTMTGTLNLPANGLVAGANQLVLSGGNVGIGTATPAAKLHLAGLDATKGLLLDGWGLDGPDLEWRTPAARHWNIDQSGSNPDLRFFTHDSADANGQLAMTIQDGGNVGIGTVTPQALLSLGAGLGNTKLALFDMYGDPSHMYGMGIQASQFRFHLGGPSHRFSFLNAPAGSELLTITGDGRLGIGTTDPGSKLTVAGGNIQVDSDGAILALRTPSTNTDARPGILFQNNNLAFFGGDGTQDQYFWFLPAMAPSRNYDAHLSVFGRGSNWAPALDLTHDGVRGAITTGTGDLTLNPAGDVRVGAVTAGPVGAPGYGARLSFSGGPKLWEGHDSDNSDPLWIARYNFAADVSQLRLNLGEDDGLLYRSSADRFVVGTTDSYGQWTPSFTVTGDGATFSGTNSTLFIKKLVMDPFMQWYWQKVATVSGQWGRIAYRYENPSGNNPAASSGEIFVINDNFSLRMLHNTSQYGTNNNLQFARSGNAGEPGVIWFKATGSSPGTFYVTENQNCTLGLSSSDFTSELPYGAGTVVYPQLGGDAHLFSGDVGIGTFTPAAKLDVHGNVKLGSGSEATTTFYGGDFTGARTSVGLALGAYDHGLETGAYQLRVDPNANYDLNILRGYGTFQSQMYFRRNDGAVGIGTTNPGAKLEVVGSVKATSFKGGGSELTGVTASGLGAGTYPNSVTFNNGGNSFAGTFSGTFSGTFNGNGSGLTALNANNIANVALLDGSRAFTGTVTAPALQAPGTDSLSFKVNNSERTYEALRLVPPPLYGAANFLVGADYNKFPTPVSGSAIGGGAWNNVYANVATISGGMSNVIAAESYGATISGGWANAIYAYTPFGTVLGGCNNECGTGEADNQVYYAVAAGYRAKAKSTGDFVWADSQEADFVSTGPNQFLIRAAGGVGINTSNPQAPLDVNGNARVCVLTITGGCDLAEPFELSHKDIPKGSVVVIDEENPGRLKLSDRAYDTRVAGIVSGANGIQPGLTLSHQSLGDSGQNVALSGRVYVQADASTAPIKPGDLLTTSDLPGHAMKVTDHGQAQGAILGKAMTGLKEGRGMVLVLVSLQ
jgi:hypothetical protein